MSQRATLLFLLCLFPATASAEAQELVAVSGDSAPGGGIFKEFHHFSTSSSGDLAFIASLSGAADGADAGLFVFDGKRIERVLEAGSQEPFHKLFQVALREDGRMAVIAETADAKRVLLSLRHGVVDEIARQGVAPQDGAAFIDFLEAAVDADGSVVFVASTEGPEFPSIFRASPTGGIVRLEKEMVGLTDAEGLAKDLRVARDGTVHFLNYRRAGRLLERLEILSSADSGHLGFLDSAPGFAVCELLAQRRLLSRGLAHYRDREPARLFGAKTYTIRNIGQSGGHGHTSAIPGFGCCSSINPTSESSGACSANTFRTMCVSFGLLTYFDPGSKSQDAYTFHIAAADAFADHDGQLVVAVSGDDPQGATVTVRVSPNADGDPCGQ